MKRYLSIWLPRWPIERRFTLKDPQTATSPARSRDKAFALSEQVESGARLTATNEAAERAGLSVGMALTDARAIHPQLEIAPADSDGDAEALLSLALWAQRYSPLVRVDAPDGITIDITGCAHLFGGEPGLLSDLALQLEGFGLSATIAITPTMGASWGLAHFGKKQHLIISADALKKHLAPLPNAALRLEEETQVALIKVGLKEIGHLLGKPRAPLATRFGRGFMLRLGQALGEESETFHALTPPPLYRSAQRFAEPVVTLSDIERVVEHLTADLAAHLHEAGKGARRLELTLFRIDGWAETLTVRTSLITQNAKHLARLFAERLPQIKDVTGFGFEVIALAAYDTERADAHQHQMAGESSEEQGDIARLLDRFINRFGPRNVTRFCPRASYIPERAARAVSVLRRSDNAPDWNAHAQASYDGTAFARPLLLFAAPEPISVLVETPDHPPERFEWRRISHRVTRAEGPERLAPEWWRGNVARTTRDYYRVEDEAGRRFWLYRDGLYDREGDAPRWFIHGLLS